MHLISTVVTFLAAFAFGVLAHRSPKRDWEFIKGWPAITILLISVLVGEMEQANKIGQQFHDQYPAPKFVCEWVVNDIGILTQKCDYVAVPGVIPPRPSVSNFLEVWIWEPFLSSLLDIPTELIGIMFGRVAAKLADGSRKSA